MTMRPTCVWAAINLQVPVLLSFVGKTSILLSVGVSFSGPQLAAPRANLQMPKRRRTFTTRTGTNKAVALESAATEAATKSAAEGQHFH